MYRAFQEAQVADEKRKFEEADTKLIDWPTREVEFSIDLKICFRSRFNRKSESVPSLYTTLSQRLRRTKNLESFDH